MVGFNYSKGVNKNIRVRENIFVFKIFDSKITLAQKYYIKQINIWLLIGILIFLTFLIKFRFPKKY